MPRSLSIASIIEKANQNSNTAFLSLLEIIIIDKNTNTTVEVVRIVNNDEDITFNGDLYSATVFDLNFSEESGSVGRSTVTVNDFTGLIRQREEQVGGANGFSVKLMIVNADELNSPPEVDLNYQVVRSTASNYNLTWELGSENVLAMIFPIAIQYKDRCRFKYKDPQTCAYSGPIATCDLSLNGPNGCGAHNNSLNFGAFAGINN